MHRPDLPCLCPAGYLHMLLVSFPTSFPSHLHLFLLRNHPDSSDDFRAVDTMTLSPKHTGISPGGALKKPVPRPTPHQVNSNHCSGPYIHGASSSLQVIQIMQPGLITPVSRSCSAVSVGGASVFFPYPCQVLVADKTLA